MKKYKIKKHKKENRKKVYRKMGEYLLDTKYLIVAIVVMLFTIITLLYFNYNKSLIKTDDIKIYYRTYTKEKGWTNWSQNGQESGTKKYPIRALEIKVKAKNKGDIFYNTYSNKKWIDNDVYSGKTAGDKKNKITKVKMMLSDTLYRRYNIRYRLFTNKKTTEYGYNYYELSGDKEIYKIQIVVEEKE